MRVSTAQIFHSGIAQIQRAQSELDRTNLQMTSGKRILTAADDPAGATRALQINAAISATEQYQRNADLALPRLELEDIQLTSTTNALQRVRELVVAASNDSYNADDREIFAAEIRQLSETILGYANSKDANGEYLFAGINSQQQPFQVDADGLVSYVGADGSGAVREVEIASARTLQVGDTGKSVFMDIPEQTGKVLEVVAGLFNTGTAEVDSTEIIDADTFALNATDALQLHFTDDLGAYEVLQSDGTPLLDNDTGLAVTGIFVAGTPIEFAGRSISLTGSPKTDDVFTSRPAPYVSVFDTLDAIATALESPVTDEASRQSLSDASSTALLNIDAGIERLSVVSASVGVRLNNIDIQTTMNDERLVDLESTLSDIQDLDYAEAVSRYKLLDVVLQAAQQTYVQTSRLSLFDFL